MLDSSDPTFSKTAMHPRGILYSTILAAAVLPAGALDFGRDVFPILQRSCFECHAAELRKSELRLDSSEGMRKGGSGGTVVVSGKATESELYRRITLPREDADAMPKRGAALTGKETAILRDWINAGAVWPEAFQIPKHWAYLTPTKPELPNVRAHGSVRNEIDRFVLARLEESGMTFSPEADRATLIRRLSLDLTGIPPTPAQLRNFLEDRSEAAFETLVDRLLASEEFGVKWARPWLDYARYADSHGYQRDNIREIWAYRDWVISALNSDMPFDRFTVEQLAGDLIPGATEAQKIATGFNQNAPTNVEAGTEPEETRVNQIFDRVNTLGTVWLGTTFECSQCHDHKYDPFTMKDYYGMFAFFNGTELEADRTNPNSPGSIQFSGTYLDLTDPQVESRRRKLNVRAADLKAELASRSKHLGGTDAEWEKAFLKTAGESAREHVLRPRSVAVTSEAEWEFLDDESVLFTGNVPDKDDYTFVVETELSGITGLKVEFLADDSLPGNGPGRGNGQKANVVLNDFAIEARSIADGMAIPSKVVDVSADYSQGSWDVKRLLDSDPATGWAIAPKFGESHWFQAIFSRPVSGSGGARIELKLVQQYGGGRVAGRVRISAITGNPRAGGLPGELLAIVETAPAGRSKKQIQALREYRVENDPAVRELKAEIAAIEKESKGLAGARTLVMREMENPRESFMFKRGVYTQPGAAIEPRVPGVLHPLKPRHFEFEGKPIGRTNRLVMAQWLVDKENPIAARAAVNRFWLELFGRGLVTTPEDFGLKGDAPTHPKLLDWLAVSFMENDWSLKQMLRRIVSSATYRQSSKIQPALHDADPANVLLSRGPRFRLSAEQIRDNALAIAGLLSTGKGGEPVKPSQPDGVWSKVGGTNYKYETSPGEQRYRRGVYVVLKRGAPYPSFVNFDANNRMACRVQRTRSNTPLQALTLMNDPVFVEAATAFAGRLLSEAKSTDFAERLDHAFLLALSRSARPVERETLRELYQAQLADSWDDKVATRQFVGRTALPKGITAEQFVAWYAVATAILNLDETITKG